MATILNNNILTNKMINLNYNNIIMNQQQPSVIQSSKRLIIPATERNTVVVQNDLKSKRKMNYPHAVPYGQPGNQPASVARRNARERNRVKQVNNGFATLRQHIPQRVASNLSSTNGRGASKKLSKVDTLKMAVQYIRELQQLLDDHDSDSASTSTSNSFENSYEVNNLDQSYFGSSSSGNMNMISQTPPSSETSASPTPSFASEGSLHAVPTYTNNNISFQESYENYEPMSPEDEELLDVISWWQQQ